MQKGGLSELANSAIPATSATDDRENDLNGSKEYKVAVASLKSLKLFPLPKIRRMLALRRDA